MIGIATDDATLGPDDRVKREPTARIADDARLLVDEYFCGASFVQHESHTCAINEHL